MLVLVCNLRLVEVCLVYRAMISLSGVEDVKKLVSIANSYECNIYITSGHYKVDAKSIMSIFSLDLSKPVELIIEDCPESLEKDIKPFLVAQI